MLGYIGSNIQMVFCEFPPRVDTQEPWFGILDAYQSTIRDWTIFCGYWDVLLPSETP